MRVAGVSITVTSGTDIFAFFTGYNSVLPVLRYIWSVQYYATYWFVEQPFYIYTFNYLILSFFYSVSRSFAIFSTFGILFLYILSTTFLVGCIAIDFKRREEVRPAVSGVQCTRGVARARLSAPCVAKLVFLCIIIRAMLDFF